MKRILLILLAGLLVFACIGQKEDPVVEPDPTEQTDPEPEPEPEPDPEPDPEPRPFYRRTLLLDFTGTWCVNCPRMEVAVIEAEEARPDRIVPVAVHYGDAMKTTEGNALVKRFGVKAYPSAVIDLDPESLVTVTSSELLLSHADRLLEARPESAGLKVTSTRTDGKLTADVTVTTVREGHYSLHLILLEDGVVAKQTGGEDNHVHNHILRAWLDGPEFDAGAEAAEQTHRFEAEASEGWRLVALVCREGLVDNVLPSAVGETVDYAYENKTAE